MISYEELVDTPRPESPLESAPTKRAAFREYAVWAGLHVGVLLVLAAVGFGATRLVGPTPAVAETTDSHPPAVLTMAR